MKKCMLAAGLGLAVSGAADAAFTGCSVVSTTVSSGGIGLVRYEVFVCFNGPTDTVLNVFNLCCAGFPCGNPNNEDCLGGFWHKDNSDYNGGVLSQQYGTWAPQLVGSATLNRPFDSFLMIGGSPTGTNTTNADPSWNSGGSGSHAGNASGWSRPDLPNNCTIGWFNSSPPNLQGRVGVAPNTSSCVKIAQFVLSAGHADRLFTLTIANNNGAGGAVMFNNCSFQLGACPTPGALSLLGLAGFTRRRSR